MINYGSRYQRNIGRKSLNKNRYRPYSKRFKKVRKNYKNKATISRAPGTIVPDRMLIKLKYRQRVPLSSTSGAFNLQIFKGNGLFDPDSSGTGLQPSGFDQLSNLYGRYRVYGSRIDVDYATVGTTNPTATYEMVITPATVSGAAYTDMEAMVAAPYAVHGICNTNLATLKNYIASEKLLGLNQKAVEIDIAYAGSGTADPALIWTWQLGIQSADRTSTVNTILYCTITYYVEFYDRQELGMS